MSTLLLDTHIWLWMSASPDRIGSAARERVEDASNTLLLSSASSWEIAIKYSRGRLSLPEPPNSYIRSRMQRTGVEPLVITHDHTERVAELPWHHRDPFDRLLVAQAQLLDIPIVTADAALAAYDVTVIFAR